MAAAFFAQLNRLYYSMVLWFILYFFILLIIQFPLRHIEIISHNFETDYSELMQLINLGFCYNFYMLC